MHIMIDLETMGTAPTSAIVSIGAVAFNENGIRGGEATFYTNVNLESCIKAGMTMDARTVMWWLGQSDDARNALAYAQDSLTVALVKFSEWVNTVSWGDEVCVWGNGAAFDNVILANAHKAIGVDVPWKFWNDRCYRTLKNLYPDIAQPEFAGERHNSLADAIHQATHAAAIFKAKGLQ